MTIKHTLEQIVNISKDVFKTCSLTDSFLEVATNKLIVNSVWSQIDLEKNERTKFQRSYFFEIDQANNFKLNLLHVGQSQPLRNDIWNVKSPNNLMNAILTNWKENGEDKQFLELWKDQTRIENINLTKIDKHAKVYENSSCLGSFVWSSDSTKIAYVTEVKNTNKEKSFFTSKLANNDPNKTSNEELINENNYENKYANYFKDEWGEQYVGKSKSTIGLYDITTNELIVLDNLPEDYSPSKLTWYENKGILFNAYYTKPYRLGLIYCPIRRSELFYYDLAEKRCTQLTDFKNQNLRDPRFSNNSEYVCWLQNQARGPHFQCSKLMIMNWKTKEISTLIDLVNQPNDDKDFPGIFTICFANNCWSLDNKRILLNTQWNGRNTIASIDLETKKITPLRNELDDLNSCDILKIKDDWICALLQGYNKRPSLIIGRLPERGNEANLIWNFTNKEIDNLGELAEVELIKFKPKIQDLKYPNVDFQSFLVKSKNPNRTLVVFPHGGPHSAYCCEYSPHVAILYSLGYSVLLINYRGSSGFGQDSIDSLPGKIGTNDVSDCQQAAEFTMEKYNYKNAVLYGGSHGGYLTTQLIGQYPEFYKAAAARNPVTHLESMLFSSDIPDWIICEGLGEYDFDFKIGGNEVMSKLFNKSPMYHIDNVKTPTLLMIGNVDLRVPCRQSIEFYKALISRNVPAKLLSFKDDNHPLDKPQTTADCIVHTVLWYEKYLN